MRPLPTTLACIGASSVQGVGDPGQGGFVGRLKAWLELANPGSAVHNLGIGGQTTRDLRRRFAAEIAERSPDAVLFQLGCNDVPRERDGSPAVRVPLGEYREHLAWLFAAAKPRRTLLLTVYAPDPARCGVAVPTLTSYVEASIEQARRAEVEIIDAFAATGRKPPLDLLSEDGLHLDARGHQLMADLLRRHLQQ